MSLLQSPKGSFAYFDLVVVLLATLANCVVLIAVVRGKFNQNQSNYRRFLISLASCDLFSCIVNLITMIYQIYMSTYSGSGKLPPFFKCFANVLRTLQLAGFFTNLLNLCAMSLEHFWGVVYPVRYRQFMNENVSRIGIVSIWIVSFTMASLDIPINIVLYRDMATNNAADLGSGPSLFLNNGPAKLNHFASPGDIFANQSSILLRDPRSISMNHDPTIDEKRPKTRTGNRGKADKLQQINGDLVRFTSRSNLIVARTSKSPPSFISNQTNSEFRRFSKSGSNNGSTMVISGTAIPFLFSGANLFGTTTGPSRNRSDPKQVLSRILMMLQDEQARQREETAMDACTFFSVKKFWFEMCIFGLVLVCFSMLIVCYGIIFKRVTGKFDTSGRRTKRLVVTTVIFLSAFALCWLPFMIFEFSMLMVFQNRAATPSLDDSTQNSSGLVYFFFLQNLFNSLLWCYPLCDPLIYAFRVSVVREFILTNIAEHCPCFSDWANNVLHRRISTQSIAATNNCNNNNNNSMVNNRRSTTRSSMLSNGHEVRLLNGADNNNVNPLKDEKIAVKNRL